MFALSDGAAHVVDGLRGGLRCFARGFDRRFGQRLADEGGRGFGDHDRCRGYGADGDAGPAYDVTIEADVRGGVDDGDVHLVARNEALPGGAGTGLRRREVYRNDELARLQDIASGTRAELVHRYL